MIPGFSEILLSILKPRFASALLEHPYGHWFSPQGDKFYAATLVKTAEIKYGDFEFAHKDRFSHSASYIDQYSAEKESRPGVLKSKSVTECIDDGTYTYFSILFTGILFEGEWFITNNLSFYGYKFETGYLKRDIEKHFIANGEGWNRKPFTPHLEFGDSKHFNRNPELEEFGVIPALVAYIRQPQKEEIYSLFSNYFYAEHLHPFFQKLKINFPQEYTSIEPYQGRYILIFPEHKQYVLTCALILNSENQYRLKYFIFDRKSNQFYRWNYFTSEIYSQHQFYDDLVIKDLKQISNWNISTFLHSSCTMDEKHFWDEYVFKKENGDYLFLELIVK